MNCPELADVLERAIGFGQTVGGPKLLFSCDLKMKSLYPSVCAVKLYRSAACDRTGNRRMYRKIKARGVDQDRHAMSDREN
jgi:hypothetical protein